MSHYVMKDADGIVHGVSQGVPFFKLGEDGEGVPLEVGDGFDGLEMIMVGDDALPTPGQIHKGGETFVDPSPQPDALMARAERNYRDTIARGAPFEGHVLAATDAGRAALNLMKADAADDPKFSDTYRTLDGAWIDVDATTLARMSRVVSEFCKATNATRRAMEDGIGKGAITAFADIDKAFGI